MSQSLANNLNDEIELWDYLNSRVDRILSKTEYQGKLDNTTCLFMEFMRQFHTLHPTRCYKNKKAWSIQDLGRIWDQFELIYDLPKI